MTVGQEQGKCVVGVCLLSISSSGRLLSRLLWECLDKCRWGWLDVGFVCGLVRLRRRERPCVASMYVHSRRP